MTDLIKSEGVIQSGPYAGQNYVLCFGLAAAGTSFPGWRKVWIHDGKRGDTREVPEKVLEVLKNESVNYRRQS